MILKPEGVDGAHAEGEREFNHGERRTRRQMRVWKAEGKIGADRRAARSCRRSAGPAFYKLYH
jgi:hypothetical protein